MRGKWVDNTVYFGPDRRSGRGGMRWSERRRDDLAGDAPPLGALLRRLRVALLGLHTRNDSAHALQLAAAAIAQAERTGKPACAEAVKAAMRIISGGDRAEFAEADTLLNQALNLAG